MGRFCGKNGTEPPVSWFSMETGCITSDTGGKSLQTAEDAKQARERKKRPFLRSCVRGRKPRENITKKNILQASFPLFLVFLLTKK